MTRLAFFFFFFAVVASSITAQEFNTVHLRELADSLRADQNQRIEELMAWSESSRLPWRFNDSQERGNTYIHIDGMPVIHTTTNDGAALMTRTKPLLTGGSSGLNLDASGLVIGQWEAGDNAVLETHEALTGRVDNTATTMLVGNHGTMIAGTLIGNGVGNADARGMAIDGSVKVYSSADVADIADFAAEGGLVSNHSYEEVVGWRKGSFDASLPSNSWYWFGDTSIVDFSDGPQRYGQYSQRSQMYDAISYAAPYHLIIRATGNSRGSQGPSTGVFYAWNGVDSWVPFGADTINPGPDGGVEGYDCIPLGGNAKNIITVGGIQKFTGGITSPLDVTDYVKSGWGPADDGRVKPDLVGTATSITTTSVSATNGYTQNRQGTSFATPNISASLLLLQQHHHQMYGRYMRASTLKGLAIHTAQQTDTNPGPNYSHGWGLLDTEKAAQALSHSDTVLLIEGVLSQGERFTLRFHGGGAPVKATLCWADPASNATADLHNNRTPRLINDLDLRIFEDPNGVNTEHLPWKLDVELPAQPAVRGDNIVDNVEVVEPMTTASGLYDVVVEHKGTVVNDSQHFSLIINGRPYGWNGNSSEEWHTATNWSDGIPSVHAWVNIPSGCAHYPMVETITDTVGALSIQSGGYLTVKSKLMLLSDVVNQGTLLLDSGQLKWNGVYRGNLTQRQPTSTQGGWAGVGTSVQGRASMLGDVRTNRMNAFTWNADNAEWSIASPTDTVLPGLGHLVFYGTNGVDTSGSMLQVDGHPISQANPSIGYGTGDPNDFLGSADGWNFLSNPFACALDFSSLNRQHVGNSFSIWDAQNKQYIAYSTAGITNPYIAPMQGFWVKADNAQATLSPMSIRSNGILEPAHFHRSKPFDRLVISVQEEGDSTKSDYTVVALIEGSTKGFDIEWDALKLPNGEAVPTFYTKQDGVYAINAIPHSPTSTGKTSIPMGMLGGENGKVYRISYDQTFVINDYTVFLEDQLMERIYNLCDRDASFVYDSLSPDRFILHIGGNGINVLQNDNEAQHDDMVWVYNGRVYVRSNRASEMKVFDMQGRMVWTSFHHGGEEQYTLPTMVAGVYTIIFETLEHAERKKFIHTP